MWRSALFKYNYGFSGASMLNISFCFSSQNTFKQFVLFFLLTLCRRLVIRAQQCSKGILLLQVKQKPTFHSVGRVGFLRWDLKWKKKVHRILYSLQACCCGKALQKFPGKRDFLFGLNPFIIFIITGTDFGFLVRLTNILVNGRNKRSSRE